MVHHSVVGRAPIMLMTPSVVLSLFVNIGHVFVQSLFLCLAHICKTHGSFQSIVNRFEHVAGSDFAIRLRARWTHTMVCFLV